MTPEAGAIGSRGIAAYGEDEFVAHGFAETLEAAGPVWAATMRLADPRLLHRSAVALTRADLRATLEALDVPRTLITGDAVDPDPGRAAAFGRARRDDSGCRAQRDARRARGVHRTGRLTIDRKS